MTWKLARSMPRPITLGRSNARGAVVADVLRGRDPARRRLAPSQVPFVNNSVSTGTIVIEWLESQ
jgi:hypothetical protein